MKWIPRLCGATLAAVIPHWVEILYAVLNICGLRCLQSDNVSTPWWSKNKIVNSDKKRWFTFLLSGCFIRLIIKESYGGVISDFTETRASLFQDFICKRESGALSKSSTGCFRSPAHRGIQTPQHLSGGAPQGLWAQSWFERNTSSCQSRASESPVVTEGGDSKGMKKCIDSKKREERYDICTLYQSTKKTRDHCLNN